SIFWLGVGDHTRMTATTKRISKRRSLAAAVLLATLVVFALAQSGPTPLDNDGITFRIGWPVLALILFVLLVANGLLIAAETAVDLLRPLHIKHMKERGENRADRLQLLLDRRHPTVAACKLGSDLARLLIF